MVSFVFMVERRTGGGRKLWLSSSNKAKAISQAKPPSNRKELQRLLGQINFLRFIANLAGRTKVFSPLLRLKDHEAFVWNEEHQKAFDAIK